jgi:hypothetical protein
VETSLRAGCTNTICHPFQVAGEQLLIPLAFQLTGCSLAILRNMRFRGQMRASKRIKTQTRSVTAKVTPECELALKRRAEQSGMSLSEYARHTLLASLNASADIRLLLSELLALRKIFILLQVDSCEGKKLSEQRLRYVVDQAEATKFSMADGRIRNLLAHPKEESGNAR